MACNDPIGDESAEMNENGDNHIQNIHLGRYIIGYTVGNHVLQLRLRVTIKLNFRPYIKRHTSQKENCEYSYTLSGLEVLIHGVISLSSCDKNTNYKRVQKIKYNRLGFVVPVHEKPQLPSRQACLVIQYTLGSKRNYPKDIIEYLYQHYIDMQEEV